MSIETFPPVSLELIEALDRTYPNRCPDIDTPERELWAAVGAASVVTFLRRVWDEQNERSINDN